MKVNIMLGVSADTLHLLGQRYGAKLNDETKVSRAIAEACARQTLNLDVTLIAKKKTRVQTPALFAVDAVVRVIAVEDEETDNALLGLVGTVKSIEERNDGWHYVIEDGVHNASVFKESQLRLDITKV